MLGWTKSHWSIPVQQKTERDGGGGMNDFPGVLILPTAQASLSAAITASE